MPDRYVGHRTPEGGWSWEAAGSPSPQRGRHGLLIALAAVGAVGACLLGAAIILTASGDNSKPSINPSPTAEPTFSLMVWNRETDQWQAENLNLGPATGGVTFLVNIDSAGRTTHEVGISFECAGTGSIELVDADDPAAPLTAPGPGRLRPDATALGGALAAWSATFSGAPEWDAGGNCSELQTLRFVAQGRGETSSFILEASEAADVIGGDRSISVAASVDGEPAQTLSVGY